MSWAAIALAGVNALGSLQQSQQQASIADFNKNVATVNAAQERAFANADAARARKQTLRERGKTMALAGASGVDSGSGSILDVIADDAIESELNALNIQLQGEARARQSDAMRSRFKSEASNIRSNMFLSALGAGARGYASGSSFS